MTSAPFSSQEFRFQVELVWKFCFALYNQDAIPMLVMPDPNDARENAGLLLNTWPLAADIYRDELRQIQVR